MLRGPQRLEQVITEFQEALRAMLSEARSRRFGDVERWVNYWLDQLQPGASQDILRETAKRAARGLGGMEGIGEGVPRTPRYASYHAAVERIYRAAKNLETLCGGR